MYSAPFSMSHCKKLLLIFEGASYPLISSIFLHDMVVIFIVVIPRVERLMDR